MLSSSEPSASAKTDVTHSNITGRILNAFFRSFALTKVSFFFSKATQAFKLPVLASTTATCPSTPSMYFIPFFKRLKHFFSVPLSIVLHSSKFPTYSGLSCHISTVWLLSPLTKISPCSIPFSA